MTFEEVIAQLEVWEEWRDNYNKLVPLFIQEAKTGKDWTEWDKDIFYEFFEKSGNQCVSSLRQGYFTNKEKENIRDKWTELAPMLQNLALSQDEPRFDIYKEVKKFLRQHTFQDRRAATNRLIASLQPQLLCTIVNEHNLWQLFNYLKNDVNDIDIPIFIEGDWFINSFNLWRLYQTQIKDKDYSEIITFPWETFEYFLGNHHLTNSEDNDMSEENIFVKEVANLLNYKKQIILQGAPGTGKTYIAGDIAEYVIWGHVTTSKEDQSRILKDSDQFKLVQFHPSYTYEDFVRGIETDIQEDSITPRFKVKNKILGKLAKEALKNWEDSQKSIEEITTELNYEESLKDFKDHISESLSKNEDFNIPNTTAYIINVEEDAFRYHYKNRPKIWYSLLYTDILKVCLNKSKIKKSVDVEDIGLIMKGKHPYYYHFCNALEDYRKKQHIQTVPQKAELKNYVLVIDEINRANLPAVLGELIYAFEYRGEQVESMYAIEGNHGFILPPNLYIIGTMNTADRSVGQIDYAIRRRFAFVDMLPTPLLEEEKFDLSLFVEVSKLFIDNYDEYFNDPASNLKPSIYLSNEFRPEDVWIGHSYFIMKDRSRHMRLKYEIIPILKEYLRDSILKESAREIIEKLK